MKDVIETLIKMEAGLIRKRQTLTKIRELLIYKKDKETVEIARNNIHRTILKVREIKRIFKYKQDSIKGRII
ncbi:hypothetical protein LCGC14_0755460 [marine sediment metagenome]|uniref:Uncharacterized protein n=1 Tax=marine sediment metagenome TaxID=412755 RepID=A0A0F9T9R5_9ZZZZ